MAEERRMAGERWMAEEIWTADERQMADERRMAEERRMAIRLGWHLEAATRKVDCLEVDLAPQTLRETRPGFQMVTEMEQGCQSVRRKASSNWLDETFRLAC